MSHCQRCYYGTAKYTLKDGKLVCGQCYAFWDDYCEMLSEGMFRILRRKITWVSPIEFDEGEG